MSTTFNNARKCLKCGWEWIVRNLESEPKRCPRCRTKMWKQEQDLDITGHPYKKAQ